ncbi:MAG TPA: FAD-binding oxidoreductase [Thermodesulfobacteriota bacterium]|nr:FAD-binding oxidoreductase [Thermodesulfobacteriota bacterium]
MTTMKLKQQVSGHVVHRSDDEYESIRHKMVWNALKPERYPELIVQAASEQDVIGVVNYAREKEMKIAVRGGGHSWCASSLRDGGILLDLSRLNAVEVDPEKRVATIQPVVTNREFARKLAPYDLAFPFGHCPSVPISGYILGGGLGWNTGFWGVACFSLLGLDVVTADGKLVKATEDENSDLLWAARGSGPGFFGVATKYCLRVYPLPKAITTSMLMFSLDSLPEIIPGVEDVVRKPPPFVELALLFTSAPPLLVADRCERVCMVVATAFADTTQMASDALSAVANCPLKNFVMKDLNANTTFDTLFDTMDALFPEGKRYAVDNMWSDTQPITVLSTLRDQFIKAPSPQSLAISLILPPPAANAPQMPDAAFSMIAPVYIDCSAVWDDASRDKPNIDWLRSTMRALEPIGIGHYVGEVDLTAHPSRSVRSFNQRNWERLEGLRKKYDPKGIFHSYIGSE